MSLVQEYGSQLITQFTVPYRGTWRSVAVNQLAPDTLYNSMNVYIREGKLRERPGLALLNSTVFDNEVLGSEMTVTLADKIVLAVTKSKLYELKQGDSVWSAGTPANVADTNNVVIDMAFVVSSGIHYGIIASEGKQLKSWVQGQPVATIATAPFAKSVCIASRRVVALVPPHTIRWTTISTIDTWSPLAINIVSQSNDVGICVKTLSNLAYVLYKERSIYPVRAQAGSDAAAFSFGEPLRIEGPAGIQAVVDIDGTHFYMTKNGRVAMYDGTRYPEWIADGLWLYLQQDIDPLHAYKIFGVFNYRLHTLLFVYPRLGDEGAMYGGLLINLPLVGSGVEQSSCFLARFNIPVRAGCEQRFNNAIDASVFFGSAASSVKSYIFDEDVTLDNSVPYTCSFQTSLIPMPEMKHYQISVESFLERQQGYGTVDVASVTLDALENKTGTVNLATEQSLDLGRNPVQEYVGFNVPSRFFGLNYTWPSTSKVRYAGASVYGRSLT
jgi:hypothetical protein